MKFSLSVAFLAVFIFTSCEIDEPPRRTTTTTTRTAARYPAPPPQYPPPPQPFPGDTQPPTVPTDAPQMDPAPVEAPASTPPTTAGPATAPKGDYPYGVPVPGKPGFVRSPYSPDKMTDVRGYAPGTEVKDPYTQKIFLVP